MRSTLFLTAVIGIVASLADASAIIPRDGIVASLADASAIIPRDAAKPKPKPKTYTCPFNTIGPLCCTGPVNAGGLARNGCTYIPPGTQCGNGAVTPQCCAALQLQAATGCSDAPVQK